ncbi:hypothetical protein DFJ74DRAFT_666196 [Hyaloraphidium curvatum]|nr:hypothetical protein DFJ74DRAFT_666196 [Hyaloraphidium curvatum]
MESEETLFAVDFYGDYNDEVVIGRGPTAHVDLGAEERRISKKHVVIQYAPDLQVFQLQCLGVNSCRVNGHVETRRCPPTILENGDVIEIDGKLLRFQFPLESPPPPHFLPKRASAETYEEISLKRRRPNMPAPDVPQSFGSADVHGAKFEEGAEAENAEVLSPEELQRPNVSWANLIVAAFASSGKQYLLVSQIYEQIARNHAYFRAQKNNNWKNAVRHALSVHSCFYRVNENEYKGGFWGYRASDKPKERAEKGSLDLLKKHEEVFMNTHIQAAAKAQESLDDANEPSLLEDPAGAS